MSFKDTPIQDSGILLVCFMSYLMVHLSIFLMIPLDVTSAAHSEFFSGTFMMPNITGQNLLSIKGTGKFINAPGNRFGLSLQ